MLMYHRIAREDDPGFVGDPAVISAAPEVFERQIRLVQRWFSPISLHDLLEFVVDRRPLPSRPALITFDDGYLDNYTAAFPVLRRAGVPAVVFLMTSFMGTGRRPWWDMLDHLFRGTRQPWADIPVIGRRPLGTHRERRAALREFAEELKNLPGDEMSGAIDGAASALEVAPVPDGPRLFMNWDEIRTMAAEGISFQPHTHTHPILSRVSEEQVHAEVAESVRQVAENLGSPPVAFAYPNGRPKDYGEVARRALREAGIPLAFATTPGPVRLQAVREAPLDIPRVGVYRGDRSARFAVKVAGLAALAQGRHR